MRIIVSIWVWVAGTFVTMATFFAAWLIKNAPFPVKHRKELVHAQCFWWADALVSLNPFWSLDVRGLEHITPGETFVIVANHQSLADIILLYKIRTYFKWVAKEELLKVPFIGGLLAVNDHIMLSRGTFGSIKKVYREAAAYLRAGISVAFFPEGTRSGTDEMGEFQSGAFKLAMREKRRILPVFIGGTREAIPKGGWIFKTKVRGRLVVLPPVETADRPAADFEKLSDEVRSQLKALAAGCVQFPRRGH